MLRVRRSLRELEEEYERGEKKPLEDLMRAWKGIKEKDPDDGLSFFEIAGYHGEPFAPPRELERYWGGYCNHGNVLFPLWHRVYVLRLEEALRSIVPDVTMPYWDETSQETLDKGIPWSLTADKFELDGEMIPNPLKSYVLQRALPDLEPSDHKKYYKPMGYETCRYPLSGLVGTEDARGKTRDHNCLYNDYNENVKLLNTNVRYWLIGNRFEDEEEKKDEPRQPNEEGVYHDWSACLSAPNYTAFSNTTSAEYWNQEVDEDGLPKYPFVVSLEQPHNSIHLAVGGFDKSGLPSSGPESPYKSVTGANGDMGENNTAGFDPIFFFHHCNVDRMFWVWQKLNGFTDEFTIIPGYKGTNPNDAEQGPTREMSPDDHLTMQYPLRPFLKPDGQYYTGEDCINIVTQLNFTYSPGSLDTGVLPGETKIYPRLEVRGLRTNMSEGSYVVLAFISYTDETGNTKNRLIGAYPVLTRWNTEDCRNCQSHAKFNAEFDLGVLPEDILQNRNVTRDWFKVLIKSKEGDVDMEWNDFELIGWGRL